jgi:DNA-binding CsgD family transcriptional regulator
MNRMVNMKKLYRVDLNKIEGTGDFPCPVCKSILSPEDMDEKVYKVLEVRSVGDDLDEILLQCNNCKTTISVTGFEKQNDSSEKKLSKKKPLKGKTDKQILQILEDGSSLTLNELAEILDKKPKMVYKALKKLFEKGKISNNAATRTYMLVKE